MSVPVKSLALFLVLCISCVVFVPASARGAKFTTAQKKELASIKKNLSKVSALIKRKKVDEATTALEAEEDRLKKLIEDAGIQKDDKLLISTNKLIELRRKSLERAMGGAKKGPALVSFETEIAPILTERCLRCHGGQRQSGNLRMDTFANMKRPGRSGYMLVVGNPANSLIIKKLTATGNQRMPRNGAPLDRAQIELIAKWILQGAKFDGSDETAGIGKSAVNKKKAMVQIKVEKATGNESVSFMSDVAPWMLDFCLRCHSGNTPASGFSVATFEDILRGGESGKVVIPGKSGDSRIWHLVGLQDPIKMPQGQALLKRSNANALKTWIDEGAKFDGEDAKGLLRPQVPTEDELKLKEMASFSPEKFAEFRRNRNEELWKRAFNSEPFESLEDDEFIVYGNANAARLKKVSNIAKEQIESIKKLFNEKLSKPFWRGKLTIFVMKDRFSYSEFNQNILDRRVSPGTTWNSLVTPAYEDAYLVLQDIGDTSSAESADLRTNIVAGLVTAAIQRGAGEVPPWVSQGLGMLMAYRETTNKNYFESLRQLSLELAGSINRPEELVEEGTFSPSGTTAIGFTLVEFMVNNGGIPKFAALIKDLKAGGSARTSIPKVYGTNLRGFATSYGKTLRPGKVSSK